MGNLELLAAVNKIGGWVEVLMKIFIKTSDICQESNLTEGPTNYILLVSDDRLDSSCITFRQIPSVSSSKPLYSAKRTVQQAKAVLNHPTNFPLHYTCPTVV